MPVSPCIVLMIGGLLLNNTPTIVGQSAPPSLVVMLLFLTKHGFPPVFDFFITNQYHTGDRMYIVDDRSAFIGQYTHIREEKCPTKFGGHAAIFNKARFSPSF